MGIFGTTNAIKNHHPPSKIGKFGHHRQLFGDDEFINILGVEINSIGAKR